MTSKLIALLFGLTLTAFAADEQQSPSSKEIFQHISKKLKPTSLYIDFESTTVKSKAEIFQIIEIIEPHKNDLNNDKMILKAKLKPIITGVVRYVNKDEIHLKTHKKPKERLITKEISHKNIFWRTHGFKQYKRNTYANNKKPKPRSIHLDKTIQTIIEQFTLEEKFQVNIDGSITWKVASDDSPKVSVLKITGTTIFPINKHYTIFCDSGNNANTDFAAYCKAYLIYDSLVEMPHHQAVFYLGKVKNVQSAKLINPKEILVKTIAHINSPQAFECVRRSLTINISDLEALMKTRPKKEYNLDVSVTVTLSEHK